MSLNDAGAEDVKMPVDFTDLYFIGTICSLVVSVSMFFYFAYQVIAQGDFDAVYSEEQAAYSRTNGNVDKELRREARRQYNAHRRQSESSLSTNEQSPRGGGGEVPRDAVGAAGGGASFPAAQQDIQEKIRRLLEEEDDSLAATPDGSPPNTPPYTPPAASAIETRKLTFSPPKGLRERVKKPAAGTAETTESSPDENAAPAAPAKNKDE